MLLQATLYVQYYNSGNYKKYFFPQLAIDDLFEKYIGLKIISHGFIQPMRCSAIVFQVIGKKDIKRSILLFGPGMYGKMRFGKTDYTGIAATRKVMICFAYFGKLKVAYLCFNKIFKEMIINKLDNMRDR